MHIFFFIKEAQFKYPITLTKNDEKFSGLCEVILQPDEGMNAVAEFPFLAQADDICLLSSHLDPELHSPDINTGRLTEKLL